MKGRKKKGKRLQMAEGRNKRDGRGAYTDQGKEKEPHNDKR